VELTVYIPDESLGLLGEEPQKTAQDLIDREILRLWHVRRSQPKPPREARPVGRPPIDKRWQEMVREGEAIFHKLWQHAGAKDFHRVYGIHEEQFRALVQARNSIALEEFLGRRPWEVRR